MQPVNRPTLMRTRNPSVVEPEQKDVGGKKRKRHRKTLRKNQLKKRHYRKTRKH
jgi:hypothetical protein